MRKLPHNNGSERLAHILADLVSGYSTQFQLTKELLGTTYEVDIRKRPERYYYADENSWTRLEVEVTNQVLLRAEYLLKNKLTGANYPY